MPLCPLPPPLISYARTYLYFSQVKEMEEELERHHSIRSSLELELQSLNQRLSTVENFRDSMYYDNNSLDQSEDQISRSEQS